MVNNQPYIRLTVSVALVDRYVSDAGDYVRKREAVRDGVAAMAARITGREVEVEVNAADNPAAGDLYLTVTGTSAESGDDGQTGRGNRANGLITPGSIGTSWLINILIIAVLGGMRHPIGPFLGAIVFVLLQTFAIDVFDRERFNLVIDGVFLAIVLFSPDGLLGLWSQLRAKLARLRARPGLPARR